jgi:hypothetical protein
MTIKEQLKATFEMTEDNSQSFVGIQWTRDRLNKKITLHQTTYLKRVLDRFRHYIPTSTRKVGIPINCFNHLSISQCPTTPDDKKYMELFPYSQILGSLMFAMVNTRPDLAHPVGLLSRFMSNPGKEHWEALCRTLKYIDETINYSLTYGPNDNKLHGYSDSDWGTCPDTKRSITGYVFIWKNAAISWKSRRQATTAHSSCEAEYIALSEAASEAMWIEMFLTELGIPTNHAIIYGDNNGAMMTANNPTHHSRMKHIDIKWHSIREYIEENKISIARVNTKEMVADALTKPVPYQKLVFCLNGMGLIDRHRISVKGEC